MSQGDILLTEAFVVRDDMVLKRGAILGKVVRSTGPGGKEHVEEVRRAPHHAATGPGPVGHHGAAALQVGHTLGHQERQAHRVAGGGRRVRHRLPQRRVMLQIVEGRHGADPIAQGRMGGHILHAFTIDPHLPRVLLESLHICFSGTCGHGLSSFPQAWEPSCVGAGCAYGCRQHGTQRGKVQIGSTATRL